MTPTEAALYLGIPNICMVCYGNEPKPPFDRECIAMSPMQKVIWSIVGDSSCDNALATFGHLEEILRLSEKFSNIHGAIFDDFFAEERRRLYTPQVLTQIRERLRNNPVRPLDMWLSLIHISPGCGACQAGGSHPPAGHPQAGSKPPEGRPNPRPAGRRSAAAGHCQRLPQV